MWDALIDQTGSLQRQIAAMDASGGTTRASFTTLIATVNLAVQPMDARTIEDYARRAIQVDTMIYTTDDLNSLVTGGAKSGDRFIVSGLLYVVKGVRHQINSVLSDEPLYEIVAKQLIV